MSNELMHYGVLGQRWGVRRYQNPDGTLTNAGKRRYKNEISSEHYVPDGKQPYEMSNAEMRSRINRMKLENEYTDYYNHINDNPKKINSQKGYDPTQDNDLKMKNEAAKQRGETFFKRYKKELVGAAGAAVAASTIALGKKIINGEGINVLERGIDIAVNVGSKITNSQFLNWRG